MYLHIRKQIGVSDCGDRRVALYHRNTSTHRKAEILADLKLPLGSPGKKLIAVVATISLGMFS